jgi:hypothetical protein
MIPMFVKIRKSLILLIVLIVTHVGCNDKPEFDLEAIQDMRLQCYPNPAMWGFHITVNNANAKTYIVKVFDPHGATILEESDDLARGEYVVSLDGRPEGTYQAVLLIDNVTLTKKLIKYEF